MRRRHLRQGDWVLACDGRKALILENKGDERNLNLHVVEVLDHENRPTRALGTDRPGRVHQRLGAGRSSVEQTDFHDEAETAFLKRIVDRLNASAQTDDRAIVVVAGPRALGVLRSGYSAALAETILMEIPKEVVNWPVHETEAFIAERLLA